MKPLNQARSLYTMLYLLKRVMI